MFTSKAGDEVIDPKVCLTADGSEAPSGDETRGAIQREYRRRGIQGRAAPTVSSSVQTSRSRLAFPLTLLGRFPHFFVPLVALVRDRRGEDPEAFAFLRRPDAVAHITVVGLYPLHESFERLPVQIFDQQVRTFVVVIAEFVAEEDAVVADDANLDCPGLVQRGDVPLPVGTTDLGLVFRIEGVAIQAE